jgi:hypothetical protein
MVATDVQLTATQPPGTDFDGEKSDAGWESRGNGHYVLPVGALNYDERGRVLFVVTLASSYFTSATSSFDAVFQISGDGGTENDRNAADNVFAAPMGVPNLMVESAVADPSIRHGDPGLLVINVRNTGPGEACGVYLPHVGCTPFALDVFLDPGIPPRSFPIEAFGDCYVFVDPVFPGVAVRAVISFTLNPELQFEPGFCRARPFREMWLKVDNWDPSADPFPDAFGLVPESNEHDNLFVPGVATPNLYLPVLIRKG